MSKRIAGDVTLERDLSVSMSDGVQLMANVFRSFPPRRSPVLLSVTPYSKDTLPDRRARGSAIWTVLRGQGLKHPIRCSG